MKILKCLLMIVTAPVILVLTLFVWICTGLIYISGLVLGLLSIVIALLGVAVLITYSLQNGVILLVMAFLISPMGLPLAAIWLLGKVQSLKFAIQDRVYGYRNRMSDLTSCLYKIGSETAIFLEVKKVKRTRSATADRFLFGKEV